MSLTTARTGKEYSVRPVLRRLVLGTALVFLLVTAGLFVFVTRDRDAAIASGFTALALILAFAAALVALGARLVRLPVRALAVLSGVVSVLFGAAVWLLANLRLW